jgi:DNA-binding transcriptional LysR family regulator
MSHFTLRQLQVFSAAARLLSHSRAAEELHLSQPAVSMQIKQLEQSIGLPLFEQIGKQIHLTEAGHEMVRYSRNIAQQIEEMDAVFDEMKGMERGQLNISLVSTANYFMPKLLAKFIQAHPNINVNLHVANRDAVIKQLEDNAADLAITGQPPEDANMVSQVFMQNPLVVIAAPSHRLANAHNIQPEQLAGETFLLREQGSGTRDVMERFFTNNQLAKPSSMEMHTNEAIKQSVQAGMGLSITSLHGIELKLETNRLTILDVANFPIMRYWHIVHRANRRLSLAAQAFKQFLIAEAEILVAPVAIQHTK